MNSNINYKIKKNVIIRLICNVLAFCMLVLAYLGFSWGEYLSPVQKSGVAVSFVFDISNSMLAKDCPQNTSRIEAAAIYAKKLLQHIESTSVSVVLAKGDGYIAVPLTEDYEAVFSVIDALSPNLMTSKGSNIGAGIDTAISTFPSTQARQGTIVVFTDGEETLYSLEKSLLNAINHGIGVYNGIKTLTLNGITKDYLEILYQGTDKIYIPVEKIELISKYSGREGIAPKINKLGGADWSRTKNRVKTKVNDIADKLLKLYAERESKKGFAFSKDCDMSKDFENDFKFDLTADQSRAIVQIKEDMESIVPMDRLLCGDVGFGKTEVAFRAMMKAVLDSKQVLYLCPTTILSNQQYESAKSRFSTFPVNMGLLNRFVDKSKQKKTLEDLKNGKINSFVHMPYENKLIDYSILNEQEKEWLDEFGVI